MAMNQRCLFVKSARYAPAIMPNKKQHHFNKLMSTADQTFVLNNLR